MQLPAHLLALIALGTAATAIPGCADTNTPDEAPEVEVNSDRSELERRAEKAQAQPSEDGGAAVADAATVEHEPKDDSDEATEERSEPFDCPACGLG